MADITFDDIVHAVQKLTPEQKRILKQTLDDSLDIEPTRESLLAEHARLRTIGVFDHVERLRNYYANPVTDDLDDKQLSTLIHNTATEWEQELDEFFGDKS